MITALAKFFLWALEQLSPKEEEKPKSHKTNFDVIRTDLLSAPKKTEETSTLPTSPVVDLVVEPPIDSVIEECIRPTTEQTPVEPVVQPTVEQAVPLQPAVVEKSKKPKKPKTKRKTTKKKSDKK